MFLATTGDRDDYDDVVEVLLNIANTINNFIFLLTVHLSITLVNNQLDAQLLYFIIRLLQSSTCFEQRRAHHQEVKFY